ncbi:hypothetical protein PR048_014698 [Dryococelus australis]|uniref:Uncharacterized protein n=1 Tax=Dryococelus australis TaxID=614101 RepID=A0ABQ9HFC9_9NEOP|nr:hypothetical protein PR048_014698 [Dryococelus australis]
MVQIAMDHPRFTHGKLESVVARCFVPRERMEVNDRVVGCFIDVHSLSVATGDAETFRIGMFTKRACHAYQGACRSRTWVSGVFETSEKCSRLLTSCLSARLGVRRTFEVKASGYKKQTAIAHELRYAPPDFIFHVLATSVAKAEGSIMPRVSSFECRISWRDRMVVPTLQADLRSYTVVPRHLTRIPSDRTPYTPLLMLGSGLMQWSERSPPTKANLHRFPAVPPPKFLAKASLKRSVNLHFRGQEARERYGRHLHACLVPHRSYAQGVQCFRRGPVLKQTCGGRQRDRQKAREGDCAVKYVSSREQKNNASREIDTTLQSTEQITSLRHRANLAFAPSPLPPTLRHHPAKPTLPLLYEDTARGGKEQSLFLFVDRALKLWKSAGVVREGNFPWKSGAEIPIQYAEGIEFECGVVMEGFPELSIRAARALINIHNQLTELRCLAGVKGRGKREILEKTRRLTTSSGTISTGESAVNRPGIESGSPWWEASRLTTQPPRPPMTKRIRFFSYVYYTTILPRVVKSGNLFISLSCSSTLHVHSVYAHEWPYILAAPGLHLVYTVHCLSVSSSAHALRHLTEQSSTLRGITKDPREFDHSQIVRFQASTLSRVRHEFVDPGKTTAIRDKCSGVQSIDDTSRQIDMPKSSISLAILILNSNGLLYTLMPVYECVAKHMKRLGPSCQQGTVQATGSSILIRGLFTWDGMKRFPRYACHLPSRQTIQDNAGRSFALLSAPTAPFKKAAHTAR